MATQRIIVGISGASGFIYGLRTLELLRMVGCETHLVISSGAERTRQEESDLSSEQLHTLADVSYRISDIGAAIASGSFRTLGMVVAPCSVNTLSKVAYSQADNLLTRAADVCLKERRRLVLLMRETPLHAGHLKAMLAATEAGAIIMPPVPAFYLKPQSIGELVHHTVSRALDLFGLDTALRRWGEPAAGYEDS
ncbi:MAG TPA: UbiX family flavin prenyltransferase, partial [Edaphobacter sp.]|nr:UbiX family flavin prenyltransferase [Edaphobacter sp.]